MCFGFKAILTLGQNFGNIDVGFWPRPFDSNFDLSFKHLATFNSTGWPAIVAEWAMPLAAVQAGQGSFPVRVEA